MRKARAAAVFLALCLIPEASSQSINPRGSTIVERFAPPAGFTRDAYPESSFQSFLRGYPLREFGAPVRFYDGRIKPTSFHISVFDMPLLRQDLVQCADAIMKLRAEYLYREGAYGKIEFTITNGMKIPFSKFSGGSRVVVSGNRAEWKDGFKKGTSREVFDEYLKFIYMYAGTYSLSREAKSKSIERIQVGDFFIQGGSPGHVVLVVDLATDRRSGAKVMLLAQSYMPSQDFHILKSGEAASPWYPVEAGPLATPEWHFGANSLKGFE